MRYRVILSPALVLFAFFASLVLGTGQVCAQVKIEAPKDGGTVFGVVTVQASKADPNDGWVAFRVTPADQKFLVAVTTPFAFEWNTAARDDKAKQLYADGDYTLEAAAYDGSGKQQGISTITVHVKNAIESSAFGQKVLLRTSYSRADVFLYQLEGSQVVDVPDPAGDKLRNPPEMDAAAGPMGGMMPPMGGMGGMGMGQSTVGVPSTVRIKSDATWTLEVLTPSATGRAIVDQDLKLGYFLCTWVWPKKMNEKTYKMDRNVPDKFSGWLPGNKTEAPTEGRFYRFKVMANGKFEEMHRNDPAFPMGQFYTELPTDPVSPGSTWNGKMAMITGLTDSDTSFVPATFRLEGFEYRGKYRCARISATHTETDVQIPWDLPGAPASSSIGGLGGTAGPPGAAPGGMPGMSPMMGPGGGAIGGGAMGGMGGMGGMGQTGPDGEPAGTLKGNVTIKRVAYFAIDEGRFVAFEDTVNKKVSQILLPDPMEMGGGMMGGGMMGGGMMGMKPLDYRGLNHLDATEKMGSLVGAGGGLGGGMGGMMGGPGGMMGGMMGGMAPPPMPGMPGMMPPGGGPPGGMMGGMMQMEPPVPAVINIDTTLKVEEVRQVAGHAVAARTSL